ncbi:MAG: hypothetical protein EOP86_04225 [Verrucomicrobiaceae bacterium]|nr:MAG: hypothetical protein EOP86_04225 [Verrucomicrobiaceae bacterium]
MKIPSRLPLSGLLIVTFAQAVPCAMADVPANALLAWWDFNDATDPAMAKDRRLALVGALNDGAGYTEDMQGRSGAAGDRAATFTGTAGMNVADGDFLNIASKSDTLVFSFWQKKYSTPNSSTFWAYSRSSLDGERGAQAHVPWSDGNLYFDTGGAGSADLRLSGQPPAGEAGFDWTQWHHFVFLKSGENKEVWIDGELILSAAGQAPLATDFYRFSIGRGPDPSIDGEIDDFAVYSSPLPEADIKRLASGVAPTAILDLQDTDGDSLPDSWERLYFPTDLTKLASGQDFDNDGLPDQMELQRYTDPVNPDTDGDGLKDGVETNKGTFTSATDTGTNPLKGDTDGDGLKDGVETNKGTFTSATDTGTNPHTADTDTDNIRDGLEVLYGSNPTNKDSTPILTNVPTLLAYWNFNDSADPEKAVDSRIGAVGVLNPAAVYTEDATGFSGKAGDRAMSFTGGASMNIPTADFLNVGSNVDALTFSFWQKKNGIPSSSAFWAYSPSSGGDQRGFQAHVPYGDGTIYFDTAGCCNGDQRLQGSPGAAFDWQQWHHFVFLKNGPEKSVWIDGSQVLTSIDPQSPLPLDFYQLLIGAGIDGEIDDFAIFGSPLTESEIQRLAAGQSPPSLSNKDDTDGDGLADAWERIYFPTDLTKLATGGDYDQDGLQDQLELTATTSPVNPDTDEDGLKDGAEITAGTNPKNPDTDGDGLKDGVETGTGTFTSATNTGTKPLAADTDLDLFPDGLEVFAGTDPTKLASAPIPAGVTTLLAWWPFNTNDASGNTVDQVASRNGVLTNDPQYTESGGGRSGQPGDLALTFGPGQYVEVPEAWFLSLAAPGDAITISLWQKLNSSVASSSFWGFSPSSGGARGIQAHIPWDNNNIYFDHAGCCNGDQRLNGDAGETDFTQWRHFAFVKNGTEKEVWVDGELQLSGSGAAPLPIDFNRLDIGGGTPAINSIDGALDDFAVYAGGLTETQIKALASGSAPNTILNSVPTSDTFAITAVVRNSNGSISLTWKSEPGAVYSVESSANLKDWSTLQSQIPAAAQGAATTVSLSTAPAAPAFLRVRK